MNVSIQLLKKPTKFLKSLTKYMKKYTKKLKYIKTCYIQHKNQTETYTKSLRLLTLENMQMKTCTSRVKL